MIVLAIGIKVEIYSRASRVKKIFSFNGVLAISMKVEIRSRASTVQKFSLIGRPWWPIFK